MSIARSYYAYALFYSCSTTEVLLALLLLFLCCCITHDSPGSVLVTVTVQQQPRCEIFTLRDSHRRCFCVSCVCTCVLLYVPGVCGVYGATGSAVYRRATTAASSATAGAVLHAVAYVPVVTLCVGGWCTEEYRATMTTTSTFNATVEHTWSDLLPGKRRMHQN